MTLDIRLPMGMLFTLLGALLLGFGWLTGAPTSGTAAGVNIDAWWGTVLLVFGVAMWLMSARASRRASTRSRERP